MTRIASGSIRCPCCGNAFKIKRLLSTNTFGPTSTDLYQYASGIQPLCLTIHTCMKCAYSGYENDFKNARMSEEIREYVQKELQPSIKRYSSKLPAAVKFDLAGRIAKRRGASLEEEADFYIKASWAAMLIHGNKLEKQYREKAVEIIEKAFSENRIKEDQKIKYSYIIGEFSRRLGNKSKANEWFDKVINHTGDSKTDKWLSDLARQQKSDPQDKIWHPRMKTDRFLQVGCVCYILLMITHFVLWRYFKYDSWIFWISAILLVVFGPLLVLVLSNRNPKKEEAEEVKQP